MIPGIDGRPLALATAAAGLVAAAALVASPPAPAASPRAPSAGWPGACAADPSPPEYYAFPLVPTGNVPGTAAARGRGEVHFGSTPFGVSVAPDGSYDHDLRIRIRDLPAPRRGAYVAWVTTSTLDRIRRLGAVGLDGSVEGSVRWNKFLVVVTLEAGRETGPEAGTEPRPDAGRGGVAADGWSGPVVARGMSRSGAMHTMAGHGPFQQENCAAYGFDG